MLGASFGGPAHTLHPPCGLGRSAFARTASAAPVGTGIVAVQRFAYTNPVWVRPVADKPIAVATRLTAAVR